MKGHGKIHPKDWSLSRRFEHLLSDAITDIDNIISDGARADGCLAKVCDSSNPNVDTRELVSALGEVKNTLDDIENLKEEIYENEIGVERLKEEMLERSIS